MPLFLGSVIAMAVGVLAVGAGTWPWRFKRAAKRPDLPLERVGTLAAARPTASEANARAPLSPQELPRLAPRPQPYEDLWRRGPGATRADPREGANGLCPEPPAMTSSKGQLSTADRGLCWRTSHDLTATGRPTSSPPHHENDVWKVVTFVCHIPPLSVKERQRLLAAWGDRQPAGEGQEHAGDMALPSVPR
jgi:hypothetical protein